MPCQCRCVSQNHQFHAGTGDGDVHAAQVAEETDPAFVVGSYETDHDHIAFLSLGSRLPCGAVIRRRKGLKETCRA